MQVNKYRVWCNHDQKFVDRWFETEPLVCPENNGHTIDSSKTVIVGSVNQQEVRIIEEVNQWTGGHFGTRTVDIDLADAPDADGFISQTVIFDVPISLLSAGFSGITDQKGDKLEVCVGPDLNIGKIVAQMANDSDTFEADASVLATLKKGFHAKIGSDDLGMVVDITGSTVKTKNKSTAVHNIGEDVLQTIMMAKDFTMPDPAPLHVGESKIGGSAIPAGLPICFRYKKNGNATGVISFIIEYLY